jgi:segregation and condensation protein B
MVTRSTPRFRRDLRSAVDLLTVSLLASKRDGMVDDHDEDDEQFGLDEVLAPPGDGRGLSLDELTEAYASLISQGDDPYSQAPDREIFQAPKADEDDLAAAQSEPATDLADAEEPVADEELADDELCEISPRTILEAMLFVGHPANRPLTSEDVAALMRGVRAQEIGELVVELNREYDKEGCPYRIESTGPGYRMVLRDEFHSLRDKFYGRTKAAKLSQAAIDVLAIVAYKQPLTREEVDELRGRPSGGLLTQLVRRELLRMERPHTKPRVPRYYTTSRFLQLFGLESPDDLPQTPD